MQRKPGLDAVGAVALTGVGILFGLNNVVIKVVNEGLQPVFFAGLRSAGAKAKSFASCAVGRMGGND